MGNLLSAKVRPGNDGRGKTQHGRSQRALSAPAQFKRGDRSAIKLAIGTPYGFSHTTHMTAEDAQKVTVVGGDMRNKNLAENPEIAKIFRDLIPALGPGPRGPDGLERPKLSESPKEAEKTSNPSLTITPPTPASANKVPSEAKNDKASSKSSKKSAKRSSSSSSVSDKPEKEKLQEDSGSLDEPPSTCVLPTRAKALTNAAEATKANSTSLKSSDKTSSGSSSSSAMPTNEEKTREEPPLDSENGAVSVNAIQSSPLSAKILPDDDSQAEVHGIEQDQANCDDHIRQPGSDIPADEGDIARIPVLPVPDERGDASILSNDSSSFVDSNSDDDEPKVIDADDAIVAGQVDDAAVTGEEDSMPERLNETPEIGESESSSSTSSDDDRQDPELSGATTPEVFDTGVQDENDRSGPQGEVGKQNA